MCTPYKLAKSQVFAMSNVKKKVRLLKFSTRIKKTATNYISALKKVSKIFKPT